MNELEEYYNSCLKKIGDKDFNELSIPEIKRILNSWKFLVWKLKRDWEGLIRILYKESSSKKR
jgi:hypothetical protein